MSITSTAALNRMIECALLVNETDLAKILTTRRDLNLKGLRNYYEPKANTLSEVLILTALYMG